MHSAACCWRCSRLTCLFNLYSLVFGADLLGRAVDLRAAVLGARHGGLFAHSFYSGAISIAALVSLLDKRGMASAMMLLPVANLVLAGSWRLMLAIPLLFSFWALCGAGAADALKSSWWLLLRWRWWLG
jgi:hypothetical protein